jgi:hypothetical protein
MAFLRSGEGRRRLFGASKGLAGARRAAEVLALRQKLSIVPNGQGHFHVTDCSKAAKASNGWDEK